MGSPGVSEGTVVSSAASHVGWSAGRRLRDSALNQCAKCSAKARRGQTPRPGEGAPIPHKAERPFRAHVTPKGRASTFIPLRAGRGRWRVAAGFHGRILALHEGGETVEGGLLYSTGGERVKVKMAPGFLPQQPNL